ncbi:MAG: bifunctional 5,10-methylenetetrahydrofolate dehydrogenase/5,10-methenyltetrahydrofolate cyclohydrolase [Candidatus Thermoplasmatota archaeon]|nr:bifunctional 5,10-methylenetetrahydrofolate dehydrogenase/5,10-methenyltetrahydrofolate cyclohydrolase [Candidatus Thermoplasmatota archaeon]
MPAEIIDGNKIAETMMQEISSGFKESQDKAGKDANLVILRIGDDEGARIYSAAKVRRARKLGVKSSVIEISSATTEEVSERIKALSSDPDVTGIMIENPVPSPLDFTELVDQIPYYKDVDGTSSTNQGRIVNRKEFLTPATPSAVVEIMSMYPELKTGIVTIINRSPVVGRPLSQMLLNRDYTISVCHSKTPDLVQYTRRSDTVVAAIGKASFFTDELLNPDCTFIDVGINYVNGKVVGDGDFARLSKWIKRITPVPGGVGPITATMIFSNLLKAFRYQEKLS